MPRARERSFCSASASPANLEAAAVMCQIEAKRKGRSPQSAGGSFKPSVALGGIAVLLAPPSSSLGLELDRDGGVPEI